MAFDRGWYVWELLTERERAALRALWPRLGEPPRRLESLEEIDRLMRQKPRAELGRLLSGGEVRHGRRDMA